jgi:hypothetical protein
VARGGVTLALLVSGFLGGYGVLWRKGLSGETRCFCFSFPLNSAQLIVHVVTVDEKIKSTKPFTVILHARRHRQSSGDIVTSFVQYLQQSVHFAWPRGFIKSISSFLRRISTLIGIETVLVSIIISVTCGFSPGASGGNRISYLIRRKESAILISLLAKKRPGQA